MERVALLGTDLPPRATDQATRIHGARIATTEALLAILRFGGADRYDVLSLEVPAPGAVDALRADLAGRGVDTQRVQVVSLPRLREMLSAQTYLAIHDTSSPQLGRLVGAVRALTGEAMPCTVTAHSLSYGSMLPHFLEICAGGARPFDAVFCSSVAAREALRRLLDHLGTLIGHAAHATLPRLELIPLGIDVSSFSSTIPAAAARRLLGLPETGRYVTYVGRLSPFDKADLDVLLRAFTALAHALGGDDLRLMLAGDDAQRYSTFLHTRAQSLGIGQATYVLPNLTEPTKRLALWAADVFVSPADSVQESFGLTVLEAMAAGCPVVVADWSGYRDIVDDGATGFLVPTLWGPVTSAVETQAEFGNFMADHTLLAQGVVLDEDALTERLRQLLEDGDLRAAMGERARQRAARCAWPAIVKQYEVTWRALKQEALAADPVESPPSRLPYWEIFRHYASRELAPTDTVELRFQDAPGTAPPVSLQLLVPQETVRRLMGILSQGPQPAGALMQSETDRLALLWLAKTGSVRIRPVNLTP